MGRGQRGGGRLVRCLRGQGCGLVQLGSMQTGSFHRLFLARALTLGVGGTKEALVCCLEAKRMVSNPVARELWNCTEA